MLQFSSICRVTGAGALGLLATVLTGCAASAPGTTPGGTPGSTGNAYGKEGQLRQLARMMEGNYNSAEQAASDKEYFDIRLHIARIWKELPESGGIYLYVEQATAAAQERPYRQRVYHLRVGRESGQIESAVYELENPLRFTGQWKQDKPLATLTPDSLIAREGCTVIMSKSTSKEFRGATKGQGCESSLRGAKYAQTDIIVTPKQFISWDRGFDEKGVQVWGAKFGGYVFKKETAGSPAPK